MDTNHNENLTRLDALLDNFESDCNNSFTKLYGVVKYCKKQPEVVEKALSDYYNFPESTGGLLPNTLELCEFSVSDLEHEISDNLSFNIRDKGEVYYRERLIKTGKKIYSYLNYINTYRAMPSEIELIYEEQKYNAKVFPIYLGYDLRYIFNALHNLYNVIRGIDTIQRKQSTEPNVKLQWTCKPAVAGYIITELIREGYLDPPTTNGELSYAKLGAICEQLFTVAGHSPTAESWRKALNPESNTMPDYKRIKLKMPPYSELS